MSSLKKFQIITQLSDQYGITVKSVQKLNKILEEMGILKHYANGWLTTTKGFVYSIFSSQTFNCDLWRENIVEAIAEHLKKR